MPITSLDFDRLSEADLEQLLKNEVAEGIAVDYKREPYGTKDDQREFLKDTSSVANTAGGHIIIGMAETGGLPTELVDRQQAPRLRCRRAQGGRYCPTWICR